MPLNRCNVCEACSIDAASNSNSILRRLIATALCELVAGAQAVDGALAEGTADLGQAAGVRDLFVVQDGPIILDRVDLYNDEAGAGFTSASIQTDSTTVITILASTVLATFTGEKNLTPYTTPVVLGEGTKIQYTIVGTGTAGTVIALAKYRGSGRLVAS